MKISISLNELLTTGKAQKGQLERIDITASLYHAGVLLANIDHQEYILNKFNGVLNLEGANLQGASFRRLQLKEINLKGANLSGADLSNIIWDKADFSGAMMYSARLNKATLINANFEKAELGGAELLGGNFSNANFTDAMMDGVDLRAANFTGANFKRAIFDADGPYDPQYLGANFTDADLSNLGGAAGDYIKHHKFVYFCRTTMPDGTINNRDCELAEIWTPGAMFPPRPENLQG